MTDFEKEKLRKLIADSENIVFFGGAGVSTESGIPDFRGSGGLYKNHDNNIRPEQILHHQYFMTFPEKFYDYYRKNMVYPDAKPNAAHKALARLEKTGKLKAVITQNIDGLHTLAGSKNVIELHGSTLRNYCMKCGKFYDRDYVMRGSGVPFCSCGGMIKPDVVLYGENLNEDALYAAVRTIQDADLLIVGGTSLTVQPAASLVGCAESGKLVIINKSETPYDDYAELLIHDPIALVFEQLYGI